MIVITREGGGNGGSGGIWRIRTHLTTVQGKAGRQPCSPMGSPLPDRYSGGNT